MDPRHVASHAFHETLVCLLILLRGGWTSLFYELVVDVQENVYRVHDGALAS